MEEIEEENEEEYPPPGWKFHPTDVELLHFLQEYFRGIKPPTNVIRKLELYRVNLREMFDTLTGDPSEPNTKYVIVDEINVRSSPKIDRNVGDFYWKDLGKSAIIEGGEVPGRWRMFSLIRKTGNGGPLENAVKYRMMAYSIDAAIIRPAKFKNTVICKLIKIQTEN